MKQITINGTHYDVLSEHEGWLYLEDKRGNACFASSNGEPPEDAPVAVLMKKFEESKN